jgi:hypothetical protein
MAYTTINKSDDYFNTKLYSGNNTDNTAITGVGFEPDLTWIKNRNAGGNNCLFTQMAGLDTAGFISSNLTSAFASDATLFKSFDTDGYTIGTGGNVNDSGRTYCSWNWKANGAGSANTAGSINSTVSVNTTSGFSIVKWTGTGAIGTVGHGLGSGNIPKMIIVKNLNGYDWQVYHSAMGNGKYINLNTTAAVQTSSSRWNDTSPTDILFTVGGTGNVNQSGIESIAYCFSDVQGFSKMGSYIGNGNADGIFCFTGFKPKFVLIKQAIGNNSTNWSITDDKRI